MSNKVLLTKIPVAKEGKFTNTMARFHPEERPSSYMQYLKEFLKTDTGVDLHECPHYLYIDAAACWVNTGLIFECEDKYEIHLAHWKSFLKSKGVL